MNITKKESFELMGIEIRTSNAKEDFSGVWDTFFKEDYEHKIPNKISDDIYGLYTEYESDHMGEFTFFIGCKVKEGTKPLPGMVIKKIPASMYAKFDVEGDFPASLITKWQEIWAADLPRSFNSDFEVYSKNFQSPNQPFQIYISIK